MARVQGRYNDKTMRTNDLRGLRDVNVTGSWVSGEDVVLIGNVNEKIVVRGNGVGRVLGGKVDT